MTNTARSSLHRSSKLLALVFATLSACSERPAPAVETQRPNTPTAREDRLAAQLIDKLFQVAPGEQVVLRGGPAYLPIMEAIAIRVLGAGGKVHLLTTTDRERRYRAQDLPLEYLGLPPSSIDSALFLQSDLEINLPYDSDFRSIWPDVASERFKRHQRSNAILSQLNEHSTRRYLYLAMPAQPEVVAAVEQAGIDSAAYETLWWEAVTTDIDAIRQRGRTLARQLGQGRQIRVTTPEGTDFTFMPGDAPASIDVDNMSRAAARTRPWARRQAAFPVGLVTVLPNPRTVNGRVKGAADQCDRPVTGETFELRGGRPEAIGAETEQACVREGLTKAGSVGFLSIGLNPALRPVLSPKGNFLPEQSLGLVALGFGNNVQFGGTDSAPRWVVPLTRATVTVDGMVVIEGGQPVNWAAARTLPRPDYSYVSGALLLLWRQILVRTTGHRLPLP